MQLLRKSGTLGAWAAMLALASLLLCGVMALSPAVARAAPALAAASDHCGGTDGEHRGAPAPVCPVAACAPLPIAVSLASSPVVYAEPVVYAAVAGRLASRMSPPDVPPPRAS